MKEKVAHLKIKSSLLCNTWWLYCMRFSFVCVCVQNLSNLQANETTAHDTYAMWARLRHTLAWISVVGWNGFKIRSSQMIKAVGVHSVPSFYSISISSMAKGNSLAVVNFENLMWHWRFHMSEPWCMRGASLQFFIFFFLLSFVHSIKRFWHFVTIINNFFFLFFFRVCVFVSLVLWLVPYLFYCFLPECIPQTEDDEYR